MKTKKHTNQEQQAERQRVRLSGAMGARWIRARFDAAQTTKDNERHWSMADGLSADQEARPEVRRELRRRSRYEVMNNPYALGLVQMLANDTMGKGPRLQMLMENEELNDRLEADFNAWARQIRLGQTLRLMRRARCQDGEAFAILATNPKLRHQVKLTLNVIEADRIQGLSVISDEKYVDGIKYDEYGNPESYRVLKYHPGDNSITIEDEAVDVPAEYMLHTYVQTRPGLHRGIPEITSALSKFANLRRYTMATLAAAESAANFAAILYTDSPPDGESEDVEPLEPIELERNMMLTVPAGWKMGQLEAKHPSANYTEFVKSTLAEIARCVCSTYGSVAGDFSGFNYASGRLDNQIYHQSIIVDRTKWEEDILDPLLDTWLREWGLVNGIIIDEHPPRTWFWDGFLHVDPTKEATGQQMRLQNMTTTLAAECARDGKDYLAVLRQRAKEKKLMEELGLTQQAAATQGGGNNREDEEDGRQQEED
ncbi:MAG: phage portal protein [Victivallales bacterium]|nr:phage portal protein [Victivallales bacterium]